MHNINGNIPISIRKEIIMEENRDFGFFGGGFVSIILIILVILIFIPGFFGPVGFGGIGYKE